MGNNPTLGTVTRTTTKLYMLLTLDDCQKTQGSLWRKGIAKNFASSEGAQKKLVQVTNDPSTLWNAISELTALVEKIKTKQVWQLSTLMCLEE